MTWYPETSDPPVERTVKELCAAVMSKRHGAEFLQTLRMGPRRPASLERVLSLSSSQVHRLKDWSRTRGLIQIRKEGPRSAYYSLTTLGVSVVKGLSDLPGVKLSALIVREVQRGKALGWPRSVLEGRLEGLLGVPSSVLPANIEVLAKAMDRSEVSPLSQALGPEGGIIFSPIVYLDELRREQLQAERFFESGEEQDLDPHPFVDGEGYFAPRLDSLGEALVMRTLMDSGIHEGRLREILPIPELFWEEPEAIVAVDSSSISLSSPLVSPLTRGVFLEYASPVDFDPRGGSRIVWSTGGQAVGYQLDPKDEEPIDYGLLVRLFDSERGSSHFVVAGLKPSGTFAACRYFHAKVNALLTEFPETSFAVLLRVKRGYGIPVSEVELVRGPEQLEVSPPGDTRVPVAYASALYAAASLMKDEPAEEVQAILELIGDNAEFSVRRRIQELMSDPFSKDISFIARELGAGFHRLEILPDMLCFVLARALHRMPDVAKHRATPERMLNTILGVAEYSRTALLSFLKQRRLMTAFRDAVHGDKEALDRLAISHPETPPLETQRREA